MGPLEKEISVYRAEIFKELKRSLGYSEYEDFKKLVNAHIGELNSIMGIQFAPATDPGERIKQGLEGEGESSSASAASSSSSAQE